MIFLVDFKCKKHLYGFVFLVSQLLVVTFLVNAESVVKNDLNVTYDSFVELKKIERLSYVIKNNNHIYLKPGEVFIDNPITIERNEELFIHGGDRIKTIIRAKNPSEPLFIVNKATHINFSGIRLSGSGEIDNKLIVFNNTLPVKFDVQDSFLEKGSIDIKGPGIFRMQGTYINNRGLTHAPILIDHPDADFLAVGGNMTTGRGKKVMVPGKDIYNIWQKQGRVRIYGTGFQYSVGRADIRIDSSSALGPHVLAYLRSEGTNGYRINELSSSFLYVSPSNEKVDVLMMANGGQWPVLSKTKNHFVNYNAAGTVWLIGNSSPHGADSIAVGNAPNASIITMGNRVYNGETNSLKIKAKAKYNLGNTYSYKELTGDTKFPYVRFFDVPDAIIDITKVPDIPKVILPAPLTKPKMNYAFSTMINVKEDFGAKGDGITDDTRALQQAFKSGNQIFIPEGVYRITRPLGYSHSKYGKTGMGAGGWLVGAGKDKTIIKRDSNNPGTVFSTEGVGYFTVQDIGFETAKYNVKDDKVDLGSAVELEFNPDFSGSFATQEVIFYGCKFQGGRYAVSVGLKTGTMGSENMFINSVFKDAKYGLAIGSYNALNNIAYGSNFLNNYITIGHDKKFKTGGTGSLLNVNIVGTKKQEMVLANTSGEPWYFNGVKSDTKKLFSAGNSSIPFHLIFDQSEFVFTVTDQVFFESLSGGGLYFLHSKLPSVEIDISSKMSVFPVFFLHTEFSNFNKIKTGPNGKFFKMH